MSPFLPYFVLDGCEYGTLVNELVEKLLQDLTTITHSHTPVASTVLFWIHATAASHCLTLVDSILLF